MKRLIDRWNHWEPQSTWREWFFICTIECIVIFVIIALIELV